jgi:hypothetical protein
LRKNVASQHIAFALVKASDGTALVGASPSGYISKDGAAQGALAGAFTGLGNGQYDYAPTQAETNCNEMGLLFIAATAVPVGMSIYTTAADPSDTVRLGLTALPAAAANGAGGLPISAAGGLALDTKLANTDQITVARMGALTDWIDAGRLDLLLDAIKAKTDLALLNTIWTDAKAAFLDVLISSRLAAAGYIAPDNTGIGQINARLPADPADESVVLAAIGTRAAPGDAMTLSAAAVSAIWAEVVEGTLSAAAFLRIILAALAGITTDDGKEFYDKVGSKKRIDGTMVGKDRTVVVLDGTP